MPEETKLILFEDLKTEKRIDYTLNHLWRMEKANRFPKRLHLGQGRKIAWVESEIDAWLAARISERDGAAA
jgi:prophage regulatory protein